MSDSKKVFAGYSTTHVSKAKDLISQINKDFKNNTVRNYLIFGTYDLLTISPLLDYNIDLLSYGFSKYELETNSGQGINSTRVYTNLLHTLCENKTTCFDYPCIGVIKVKFSHYVDINEDFHLKVSTILDSIEGDFAVKQFKSYSWDDYQIFVGSSSYELIFNVTRTLNEKVSQLLGHQIKTETTFGVDANILETEHEEQIKKRISTNDSILFSVKVAGNNHFQFEELLLNLSEEAITALRVAGRIDFLVNLNSENCLSVSSRKFIEIQIKMNSLLNKKSLDVDFDTLIYQDAQTSKTSLDIVNYSEHRIDVSDFQSISNILLEFKVTYSKRQQFKRLVANYNRYLLDITVADTMVELHQAIKLRIDKIREYKNLPENQRPRSSSFVNWMNVFIKTTEQAMENRLHSSQSFDRSNNVFSNAHCGWNKVLQAYDDMSKVIAETFEMNGFYAYLGEGTQPKISDQAISLSLNHITKPESVCPLIGAEMFNLALWNLDERKNSEYNILWEFWQNTDEDNLNSFKNAMNGRIALSSFLTKRYLTTLRLMSPSFCGHIYMDVFNFIKFFNKNEKLYSFWYWASYLMDHKKYSKSTQAYSEENFLIRLLRFRFVSYIAQDFLGANGFEKPQKLMEFDKLYNENISLIDGVVDLSRGEGVFYDLFNKLLEFINNECQINSQAKAYIEINHDFMSKAYNMYEHDKFRFASSGCMLTKQEPIDFSLLSGFNELRFEYLDQIIEVRNKNRDTR